MVVEHTKSIVEKEREKDEERAEDGRRRYIWERMMAV